MKLRIVKKQGKFFVERRFFWRGWSTGIGIMGDADAPWPYDTESDAHAAIARIYGPHPYDLEAVVVWEGE